MRPTEAQERAIRAPLEAIRVQAPPGSGKTFVIAHRVAYLIREKGINPSRIIAVTFSRAMASELLARIERVVGEDVVNPNLVCTIHALCYRVLRAEGDGRRVAKEWQIRKALEELAAEEELEAGWEELYWWINEWKAQDPAQFPEPIDFYRQSDLPEDVAPVLARITTRFDQRLRQQGLITFPDMLRDVEVRHHKSPSFRGRWSGYHVIVDEGQDTSAQAMRILTRMAEGGSFFIVGDVDQTLYYFAGASPEFNMLEGFEAFFPNGLTVVLDRNFRSGFRIIEAAQKIISLNYEPLGPIPAQYRKDFLSRDGAPEGKVVYLGEFSNPSQEAEEVAEHILGQIEKGRGPAEIFVGARTRAQLVWLERALARRRIPFVNAAGGTFWNLPHVADVVAYLSLAFREDNESFRRVYDIASANFRQPFHSRLRPKGAYSPNRWLGRKFLDACQGKFDRRWQAVYNHKDGWRWRAGVKDLDAFLEEIRQVETPYEALSTIIHHYSRYLEATKGLVALDPGEDGEMEDLLVVLDMANEFDSVDEFLDFVHEMRQIAAQESWDGKVVLSTIHRLKGLERPIVYGIGWSEGLLPHVSALGLDMRGPLRAGRLGRLQDEVCLAYVLVTRAKEEVYLSSVGEWRGRPLQPSRFLTRLFQDEEGTCDSEVRKEERVQ